MRAEEGASLGLKIHTWFFDSISFSSRSVVLFFFFNFELMVDQTFNCLAYTLAFSATLLSYSARGIFSIHDSFAAYTFDRLQSKIGDYNKAHLKNPLIETEFSKSDFIIVFSISLSSSILFS